MPVSPPSEAAKNAYRAAAAAYGEGRFKEAEAGALRVISASKGAQDGEQRRTIAKARYVAAFSAARQGDYRIARARFAMLQADAADLRDQDQTKAPSEGRMDITEPALEEEAAYQHAVLTAKIGDQKGAEREFRQFIQAYPESPRVQGAVLRLSRMHGGNLPKDAETVWNKAQKTAVARAQERERKQAMCAPECLAELLRRRGKATTVEALAKEMGTNHRGTSMKSLAEAAGKHGFAPKGLHLTKKGLRDRKTPLITLIAPGHFVIVDRADWRGVSVWNPDGNASGSGNTRRIGWEEWQRLWSGVTLEL